MGLDRWTASVKINAQICRTSPEGSGTKFLNIGGMRNFAYSLVSKKRGVDALFRRSSRAHDAEEGSGISVGNELRVHRSCLSQA
jgi:hypothetical protein